MLQLWSKSTFILELSGCYRGRLFAHHFDIRIIIKELQKNSIPKILLYGRTSGEMVGHAHLLSDRIPLLVDHWSWRMAVTYTTQQTGGRRERVREGASIYLHNGMQQQPQSSALTTRKGLSYSLWKCLFLLSCHMDWRANNAGCVAPTQEVLFTKTVGQMMSYVPVWELSSLILVHGPVGRVECDVAASALPTAFSSSPFHNWYKP